MSSAPLPRGPCDLVVRVTDLHSEDFGFESLNCFLCGFISCSYGSTYYTVVSRKYPPPPPPFATLALVQNAGGAYTWDLMQDATVSLVIVSGGWDKAWGGEMLLMLAVGWRASVLRGEKTGRFCEVARGAYAWGGCIFAGHYGTRLWPGKMQWNMCSIISCQ